MSLPPEYLSTVFLLEDPPDPLPPAFAIVTAWNPDGVTVDESSNDAADRSLLRDLEERGLSGFRVTGCSPDLSHREPGWGAVLSKAEGIALGRRHRQLAVWLVLHDELILMNCKTGEESRIATFSERIKGR